jgi:hypothetical protein
MRPSNVLVVATVAVDAEALHAAAPELALPESASVRIVSPASRLSRLQWLTNEEDAAREQAAEIADHSAAALDRTSQAQVEAEVGDVDPLQAARDALATFPADELVVLVRSEDRASWLERSAAEDGFERFGIPVRYVVVD